MIKTLFSKQSWLLKSIPTQKIDHDELIRLSLFGIVVRYVEHDKGCEKSAWDDSEEGRKTCEKIMKVYVWITHDRDIMLDKLRDMAGYILPFDPMSHKGYIKRCRELEAMDTRMMKDIIDLRENLAIVWR